MHNQREMTALALGAGAAIQVADAGALAHQVGRLLTETAARDALQAAADRLLRENRGAAGRGAELVLDLLEQSGARRWALGAGAPAAGSDTIQVATPNTQRLTPNA
jgi:hypothetical protein